MSTVETAAGAPPRPRGGGDPDVVLRAVTKRFDDLLAVDALDLSIERGEFFSLLGASGCGKTTTLRMIGGFEDPTAGTIELGGRDVTYEPASRRDVNTVFQSYALFPHLTVFENVAFGLRRKRVAKDELTRRVEQALELVQLGDRARGKPAKLSGGQQQRVALARALVNRPRVLLLDEPLGALDLKLRKQMQFELKTIQREVGITFVYVTHDQEEALTMSDRLAVMHQGRIEHLGAPETVYDRPRTAYVATFLGASNLLDGTLERPSGDVATVALDAGGAVRVPVACLGGAEPGRVRVGVRPEKIHLAHESEPERDGCNSVVGKLELISFVGVHHNYELEGPGDVGLTVVLQNGEQAVAAVPGDRLRLSWRPEHTFVVGADG
jgi:spermidine/putrescine transport system ATP-binding protein